ncbi:MAG: ABC transporter permease [Clostridiales bacterium]|jgi:ABC-2 type transport system permease protein|nr:ABC transporter permease [Clostridiales bacterium]
MGNFAGTLRLAFFILRRERVISVIWILLLLAVVAGLAGPMGGIIEPEARMVLGITMQNPAMVAMMGPVYGIENYTLGAMYTNMMLLFSAMAVAVMNILLVVRHTRADEELGRYEVLRSLPVGRMANLNATMIFAVDVNFTISALIGLGLYIFGDYSMTLSGSMLFGAAMGVTGIVFAAITALFAQLMPTSRATTGYAFLTMGIFYIVRAAGDINAEVLSLISPLGLVMRAQVYVENYVWPIFVLLAFAAIITLVAYKLNSLRDIDQGFIPQRPGRPEAKKSLLSPFGLARRLLMGSIITWIIVMFALGASYGSILGDIDDFVATNELYQMLIGYSDDFPLTVMFAGMINALMAILALVPLVIVILRAKGEEKEGRTEAVLAAAVKRNVYLAGFVGMAFAASVIMQLANTIGLYLAAITVLPDPSELPLYMLLQANLVYLPALWAIMGLTTFLLGALPKTTGAIWAYFGFAFLMVFIGRLPDVLPAWVGYLSPFHYIPELPVDDMSWPAMIVLTIIAICLTAAGFFFYNRRDVKPN